jgi:hypothetical protein
LKIIIPELVVSTVPKAYKNDFLYEGKLWRTSKEDIAQGVCVGFSMMD